jgi:glycosyltransferase involved in cell wall biosynthesis
MAEAERVGIRFMLDVMHFGTPLWLKQAVGDPEFPEALEQFAEKLAGRYGTEVKAWCPFNEPLVSALFSGDMGFWPPHQRHWRGYMPVLSRVVQATARATRAIRRAAPETPIVLCDAAENFHSRDPELRDEVHRRNLRRFIVMDLLTGKVDHHHPLYAWLTNYGMSELDLEWFRTHPQPPDVLGLDYYPHSDWQLEMCGGNIHQRRADTPAGLYRLASTYYNRYGLPLMLTETSADGMPVHREVWLETILEQTKRLRSQGVPMLGMIWWPLLDQLDWDGALTHRIGKIHRVGLFTLQRRQDGRMERIATPLVQVLRQTIAAGEQRIGALAAIATPTDVEDPQLPPLGEWETPTLFEVRPLASANENMNSNSARLPSLHHGGNGRHPVAKPANRVAVGAAIEETNGETTGDYGIVVFSHLRWGFVWQRPQQFLSRFAKKHRILFVEEPLFDLEEDAEPRFSADAVMPNIVVMAPHFPPSWKDRADIYDNIRAFTRQAIEQVNDTCGSFDRPLLWYYSPMDASWSLGEFPHRGVVYDSMDELSQFTGAPPALIENESRLMEYSDVVFAGGYELSVRKKKSHDNVHFFGCGVEFDHFAQAQDQHLVIPPDIDFMSRPILGWFGVIDERIDYALIEELARLHPEWSIAMVGPVVKVDPNFLPHARNLYWLGGRDYSVLPAYCRAFDVCIMPFAINAATEYINPTKVLEYFATGKPVVSTPVKDVVRQYSELLEIARTPKEFADAVARALTQKNPERIERAIELARRNSWESTVAAMQQIIVEAIAEPVRRSAKKVRPVKRPSRYKGTPGS